MNKIRPTQSMTSIVFVTFLMAGCARSQSPSPQPAHSENRQQSIQGNRVDSAAIVTAHNRWRSQVGAPAISWSNQLEQKAQRWAQQLKQSNQCRMKHSGPGENLYWASPRKTANSKDAAGNWIWHSAPQAIKAGFVVDRWASEKAWYDYSTNSCNAPSGSSCGHYTQVVWSDSTEVGCAKAICDNGAQVWVCNYAPSGNYVGRRPY